jgi:predicted transcriptional regulator
LRLEQKISPTIGVNFMHEHDLRNKVLKALLGGSATVTEIAEALDTSETYVLPVLDSLRGDNAVECMAGDWSLSEKFRSAIA